MSFVGKILVVLQVVLSICFMAFAGAVSATHTNWQKEAIKQKTALEAANKKLRDLGEEFEQFKTAKTKLGNEEKEATAKATGEAVTQKNRADQLEKDLRKAEEAKLQMSELATIAGDEAAARRAEALRLREINEKLLASRDSEFKEKTKLQDDLQGMQLDFETAQQRNKNLLGQLASVSKKLSELGVKSDGGSSGAVGASSSNAPPGVDGIILDVQPNKGPGRSNLVEISLGSDDGLAVGHQLYVYRSGLQSGDRPRYLGKVRVVYTTPDKSVAAVVDDARVGVIQKEDKVTTKF